LRLADAGEVTRHQGGRDGGKRQPDRWTLAGVEMPDAYAGHVIPTEEPATPAGQRKGGKPPANTAGKSATTASSKPEGGKLKPGGPRPARTGLPQGQRR
jgi:hypothetical protein